MIDGARHQAALLGQLLLAFAVDADAKAKLVENLLAAIRRGDERRPRLLGHLPGVLLLRSLLRRFRLLEQPNQRLVRGVVLLLQSRNLPHLVPEFLQIERQERAAELARLVPQQNRAPPKFAKRLGVHGGRRVEVTKGEPGAVIGHDVAGERRCLVRQATHLELRGEETREQFVVHPNRLEPFVVAPLYLLLRVHHSRTLILVRLVVQPVDQPLAHETLLGRVSLRGDAASVVGALADRLGVERAPHAERESNRTRRFIRKPLVLRLPAAAAAASFPALTSLLPRGFSAGRAPLLGLRGGRILLRRRPGHAEQRRHPRQLALANLIHTLVAHHQPEDALSLLPPVVAERPHLVDISRGEVSKPRAEIVESHGFARRRRRGVGSVVAPPRRLRGGRQDAFGGTERTSSSTDTLPRGTVSFLPATFGRLRLARGDELRDVLQRAER